MMGSLTSSPSVTATTVLTPFDMIRITDDQRRRRLLRRHLLTPDARVDDPVAAADAVVALHSSDPASVYLSAAIRLVSPSVETVATALHEDRSLLRHHAMRRTLWVMSHDVARSANAAFGRKVAAAERRRSATLLGVDADWIDDGVERVVAVVEAHPSSMTTQEVGRELPDLAEKRDVAGGTIAPHSRLLLQAAFEGRIIRTRPTGSWIGSQYAWAATASWSDIDWTTPSVHEGAIDMVHRWLDRFGPGTVDDLVWWTGSTRTLVRAALDAIDTVEVELDDGSTGLVLADDTDEPEPTDDVVPSVVLLPALDPTVMGWKERGWYLAPELVPSVTDRSNNVGPTVWVDGRVVGGWAMRSDGSIAHDAPLPARAGTAFDEAADRIRSIVGDARPGVRFPSRDQRDLLSGRRR